MELNISGKNVDLPAEVQRHIERKLAKLARHLPNIGETRVEITEEKTRSQQHRFVAQITVNTRGNLLRSEERGENMLTVIDKAVKKMDRQIKRYKDKLHEKGRGNSPIRNKPDEEAASSPIQNKLVKIKRFTVKPMTADEAIEQMELLGHAFFLFFSTDSEQPKLLYRRKDDNYGLIEIKLG